MSTPTSQMRAMHLDRLRNVQVDIVRRDQVPGWLWQKRYDIMQDAQTNGLSRSELEAEIDRVTGEYE